MRMHWWPLCAVQKSIIYIYSRYILLPPIASAKPAQNGPIRCWNQPSGARHQRVTVRPYRHDGRAVDSGAITPLLRTSGSACCPWAQVNYYVEGPTKSDKRPSITSYHNARDPIRICTRGGAVRTPRREPCTVTGLLLPIVLAKTCLRRNMANAAHFTPTGPTISSGCSGATYAAH